MKPIPVAIVLGTRAELIKMAPVMHALRRKKIAYVYVHTGQHSVSDLAGELKLPEPDIVIVRPVGGPPRGRFISAWSALSWNAGVFLRLRSVLRELSPRIVLIHGDTMTTATVALAVRTLLPRRPLLAHVEAGLRSHDVLEPFPEELSRRIADLCSDVLFSPTPLAAKTFRSPWYSGKQVEVTGNTNVDVLSANLPRARKLKAPWLPRGPFLFSQMHRHENITNRSRATALVEILVHSPLPVVFVLLDNTRRQLRKFGLLSRLEAAPHVRLVDNLPYLQFLAVFSRASCVLADSGGQTEEASVLRIPAIVFRKRNERSEAEGAGSAIRTLSPSRALELIDDVRRKRGWYRTVKSSRTPFGDGRAGESIAHSLLRLLVAQDVRG